MVLKSGSEDADFMRGVLSASDDCIKVIDLDGSLSFMSEGGHRVMEVSDFNAIRGCPWPDFWKGEGNVEAKAAVEAARNGRSASFQGAADTALAIRESGTSRSRRSSAPTARSRASCRFRATSPSSRKPRTACGCSRSN